MEEREYTMKVCRSNKYRKHYGQMKAKRDEEVSKAKKYLP